MIMMINAAAMERGGGGSKMIVWEMRWEVVNTILLKSSKRGSNPLSTKNRTNLVNLLKMASLLCRNTVGGRRVVCW